MCKGTEKCWGIELVASVGSCVCDWIGDYQETVPVTVAVVVLVVSTRRQMTKLVVTRRPKDEAGIYPGVRTKW